jgi:hypothetical protein
MKVKTCIKNNSIECGTFTTKEIFDLNLKKITTAVIVGKNIKTKIKYFNSFFYLRFKTFSPCR